MKVQKAELAAKISALKSIALHRSSIPATQGILVKGGKLTAYDLTIGMTATLSGAESDEFILPPKAIEMIEKLPDGWVEITAKNDTVTLKTEGTRSRYQTIPAQEFPEIGEITSRESHHASIDGSELQDRISSVLYAVSDNSTRPIATGAQMRTESGKLHIAGCDGYRLAHSEMEYDGSLDIVVPKATLQKIISLNLDGPIEITYTSNRAAFSAKEFTVFTRLLEGEFVDYKRMIPEEKFKVEVDRRALIDSLNRAAICIAREKAMPLRMEFSGNSLNLEINSPTMEYADTVQLESDAAEPLVMGVNTYYLLDALKSFSDDNASIALNSATQPIVITADDMTAVVMPVRLQENEAKA